MSIEERFAKVVREMDAEIVKLEAEVSALKSKLRIANYPTEQATNCGKCGQYKHTPWKSNVYGHICATCLVADKDEEIEALKAQLPNNQHEVPK